MAGGVTAASVHNKQRAMSMKEEVKDHGGVVTVFADGAYRGVLPFTAAGRINWEVVERKATGGKLRVLPTRWIVKRTFAWLTGFRRLSKEYEKTVLMSKAMIIMSVIVITLRKLIP